MVKYLFYVLTFLSIIPQLGCKKYEERSQVIDTNSYINNFELLQENPNKDRNILIKSPKAIINPISNDIEILDSTIQLINKTGEDVNIKSGKATLNNSTNLIKVFDNVNISLIDRKDFFIKTNSFIWDLNLSIIDLFSPLDINFKNTKIISSSGLYNIKSSILKINNNVFNRSIFNIDGDEQYNIEIISDIATWLKEDNSLEFKSNNKQVETTINFLSSK